MTALAEPLPALLRPRILAGLIDTTVVLALCAVYFLIPLLTLGLVLPMWGVLAAVVGYLVVPLSAFKATLGMRLFGLELVGKGGHAVGPGDVLFRELLGRGFFPAAFLFTTFAGLVASWLNVMAFVFPTGIGFLFFFASCFALAFAALGHALILNRADRRSLADLMARSWVRDRVAPPPPHDAEEAADQKRERRARLRNVVLFEIVLVVGALAVPWVLTQRTESTGAYAARLQRQKLEAQVKANPDDEAAARGLVTALHIEGKHAEADKAQEALRALLGRKNEKRAAELARLVEADPTDPLALANLLQHYDQTQQYDEAKIAYRRFLDTSKNSSLKAGFGRWLWDRGFKEEAVAELLDAQKADPDLEGLHSLLGEYLAGTDRLEAAQTELYLATLEDPDDTEAAQGLANVDEKRGALPAPKLKALKAAYEKSHPR